jgi:AraC family transcriptional regulator
VQAAQTIVAGIRPATRGPAAPERLTAHEQERLAHAQAHLRVVAFIERHLFEPLDVERIAAAAGYSAAECSRRFTRLQGESVMAYVRGRRLETAAARLLADPEARLLDLAVECGFDSQAAFTRAFGRAFGVAPGRLRERGGGAPPRRRRTRTGAPSIESRVEQVAELELAGLRGRFSPSNYFELAALWERLVALRASRREECFGVFLARAPGGVFELFAATRAWAGAGAALERMTIPAGRYLVLRHHMHEGPLLPQMTAAQEPIREASDRACPAMLDFQRYPANFAVVHRWIDHYLPLGDRVMAGR